MNFAYFTSLYTVHESYEIKEKKDTCAHVSSGDVTLTNKTDRSSV